MKFPERLIAVTILAGIFGCQMFYNVMISNDTDAKIGINILHFEDNSFHDQGNQQQFTVLAKDSLIIKSSALRFVSIVHDYELIPIVVTNESDEILKVIRVCGHFLKTIGFKVHYPYDVNKGWEIEHSDLDIENYFLAQDYFNRAQYQQCINTIALIDFNSTLRIDPIILKGTGKGIDTEIEATVKRGLAILGFISSKRLSQNDNAIKYSEYLSTRHSEYWNAVENHDPEFSANSSSIHRRNE